jgi:type IV pilus assembly protein PilB
MDLIKELKKRNILDEKRISAIEKQSERQDKPIEEVIIEKNILPENKLFQIKSQVLKIPLVRVNPEKISPKVLELIPKESANYYKMIPLEKRADSFRVGMVYPENFQAQEALKFLSRQYKISYEVVLITSSDFKKYLSRYNAPQKEMKQALETLETQIKGEKKGEEDEISDRLVEEAPVIKIVSVILRQAVEGKASDIHIEPSEKNLKVRYRLDGILHSSLLLPLRIHSAVVARIKILSRLKIDETRIPQDGRFTADVADKKIDFRVSTFPTTLGEKVVLRVLDPEKGLKTLEGLGLVDNNLEKLKKASKLPYGMILVTGPTGSGKTTTLYSVLKELNTEKVNIVTLEDPVEYFIEGVNQSQVRPEIGYTFAKGLRQILRQDPDIIMVGEIRDEETANLAIHAALTGHLVLSTLHTNTAADIIPRLIDMGVKPFLIPPTLALGISQRLVRSLCPHCRKKIKATGKVKKFILEAIKKMPDKIKKQVKIPDPLYIYQAKGCEKCGYKGYTGRTGIFETIEMTDNLTQIIIGTPTKQKILEEAKAQGMITLEGDGALKILKGITSAEEIMRVIEQA